MRHRTLAVVAVLALVVLGPATAAGADPAKPTDYRSRVLSVHPALPRGVDVQVVGGDAFLELQVHGDHTVVVPDYTSGTGTEARPYLRFRADGTVERNDHSAAAIANESRYGGTPDASAISDTPRWSVVAHDGRYVWHDHRIHWMLPARPTAVDAHGRVDLGGTNGTWTVDLDVDGRPVVVRGELLLLASPSPVPWFALMAVAIVVVLGATARRARSGAAPPHRAVAVGLALAAALATVVGFAQWRSIPPGAGGNPLTAAVPAVGLVAAVVAAAVARPKVRLAALAAAVAALAGWGLLRREALLRAVLPTSLPFAVDRAGTALALGLAIGTAVLLVWRPPVGAAPVRASRTGGTAGRAPSPPAP